MRGKARTAVAATKVGSSIARGDFGGTDTRGPKLAQTHLTWIDWAAVACVACVAEIPILKTPLKRNYSFFLAVKANATCIPWGLLVAPPRAA